jgi:hypothetical protein
VGLELLEIDAPRSTGTWQSGVKVWTLVKPGLPRIEAIVCSPLPVFACDWLPACVTGFFALLFLRFNFWVSHSFETVS